MRNWYVHFVVGCRIIETIMYRNHTIRFWSGWGRVESDIQSCCGMERILIIHGSMMVRLFLPAEPLFVIGVMAENGRYPWSDWGRDDGGVLIMDMFYWDIRGKSRSRCDICVRNIRRNLRALCAAASAAVFESLFCMPEKPAWRGIRGEKFRTGAVSAWRGMMKNGGGHEEGYGLLGKYPARVEFPVFLQECRIWRSCFSEVGIKRWL